MSEAKATGIGMSNVYAVMLRGVVLVQDTLWFSFSLLQTCAFFPCLYLAVVAEVGLGLGSGDDVPTSSGRYLQVGEERGESLPCRGCGIENARRGSCQVDQGRVGGLGGAFDQGPLGQSRMNFPRKIGWGRTQALELELEQYQRQSQSLLSSQEQQ